MELKLPKPDKRYNKGKIVKDKNGRWRGNSDTVELRRMSIPASAPIEMQLNPPYIATDELADFIRQDTRTA